MPTEVAAEAGSGGRRAGKRCSCLSAINDDGGSCRSRSRARGGPDLAVFAVFLPRGNRPTTADAAQGAAGGDAAQRPEEAPAGSRASSNGSGGASRKTKRR